MIGQTLGQYRIIRKIGEGGMGTVYEAEQQHPQRAVALKVIRGGRFVDESTIRMFQREVQSLALLKHPSIAAIYESGRTEEGQHFFAMELVQGVPLNQWLKNHSETKMSPAEVKLRLALFCKICEGVSYAHQRGVIHRDIKPANILILEEPETETGTSPLIPRIKILDFGLARITDSDVETVSIQTEVGAILGTLPYMSPEQVRGVPEDIDLRADVYALGVILYEMMAGQLPYDVREAALHQAVQVILETPPKPLAKVWTGTRRPDRDLENITFKALEKDPTRRYQSALALAEDIDRYLTDQPILARPPSAVYQLHKMVNRHKVAFSFAAVLLFLMTGFSIITLAQKARIAFQDTEITNQQEQANLYLQQAEQERQTARESMNRALAYEDSARIAAERESAAVADAMRRRQEATVANAAAEAYRDSMQQAYIEAQDSADRQTRAEGEMEYARLQLTQKEAETDLARQEAEATTNLLIAALSAAVEGRTGQDVLFIDVLGQMVAGIESAYAGQPLVRARLEYTVGTAYSELRMYAAAEPYLSSAYETRLSEKGGEDDLVRQYRNSLADLYVYIGKNDRAVPLYEEILEDARRTSGEGSEEYLSVIERYRVPLQNLERYGEAEQLQLEALDIAGRLYGQDDPNTLIMRNNLAILYQQMRRFDEAEPHFIAVLEKYSEIHGYEAPRTLVTMQNLGVLKYQQGQIAEAERMLSEALEGYRRTGEENRPEAYKCMTYLGIVSIDKNDFDEAENYFSGALNGYRESGLTDDPTALDCMRYLALIRDGKGYKDEAYSLFKESLDLHRQRYGPDKEPTLIAAHILGLHHLRYTNFTEAERLFSEVATGFIGIYGIEHAQSLGAMRYQARAKMMLESFDEASNIQRNILEVRRRMSPMDSTGIGEAFVDLGLTLVKWEKFDEAEPLLLEGIAIFERILPKDDWKTWDARSILGECYTGLDDLEKAQRNLLDAYQNLFNSPEKQIGSIYDTVVRLERLYTVWGKIEDASRWRQQAQGLREQLPPP